MPMPRASVLVAAGLAAWLQPAIAAAQDDPLVSPPVRMAIVVGNQDYQVVDDLPNAARDAADMAALLRQFGFQVHEGTNLDRRGFETLIRDALLNLPQGSEVVFFYAGHGIQIGARNYLLPTDAAFADVNDLPVYAITLDRVVEALAARGSVHVVFIDACRENPFPGVKLTADLAANLVETGSGFSPFPAPLNSLVAFSTSPGQTAKDGPDGQNSPFTGSLIAAVAAAPDSDLSVLLPRVREAVFNQTGGTQVPWESSTLVRPFQFAAPGEAGFLTVPAVMSPGEGADRSAPSGPVAAGVVLDRIVDLAPGLFEANRDILTDVAVTALPVNGELAVLDGGRALLYRPDLREIRATALDDLSHTDRIQIEAGPPEGRITVQLDISLAADPCDVQAGDALDLDGVGLYRLPNEIDPAAAIPACAAAVAANPQVPRFRYQLGRAQLAAAEFEAALASFRSAGEAGHVRAWQAEAGLLLSERIDRAVHDIPQDAARAVELLEKGIAAGDPFAIHSRGLRLLREGTTPEDRQRGFELLDRAAELGHTYSMNELGIYFLTRDTDHYQPERGMTYLRESFARNDIYGMHNLGFVALYGLDGQPADPARAAGFLEQAAIGGHPKSPATLGRMVMREQLGAVDHAKAVAWYDMGLARGDAWGGTNAAEVILKGRIAGLGPADAAARAAKAMLLPDAEAAGRAAEVLGGLNRKAIDGGLQTILRELGAAVEVDGAAGPATRAALAEAAQAAGLPDSAETPRDRLLLAARLWWRQNPVRTDLY
jgi:TPR repeat protein